MSLAIERTRLLTIMQETVASQARIHNWHYAAVRPQSVRYSATELVQEQIYADCSDGVRALAYAAGVKDDPAGNGYASYGNSSSIWAHCHHITINELEPGDMATFGYSTGEHHAWMAHHYDKNLGWVGWNHGGPGQPIFSPLANEEAFHRGMTVTFCKLGVIDPPDSPEDKLREMTGFYSWVAWKLGEGPWKKYGKANPKVRPSVPTVIPPSWWKRLIVFLAARKKGNEASN